jgi:D-3-phosphoglycerate dehydrogenase
MAWTVLTGREMREEAHAVFEDFADVTPSTAYEGDELDAAIDGFDAVVMGGIEMPRERIARAANLKVIASTGVGLDAVDVTAATEHGVIVCNNPGQNTRAVAEYTIASMLAVRRQLLRADRDVRNGTWEKYGYMGPEVEGQVMGVLGYGAIGRLVLELAGGLGMRAVAFDPYVDEEEFAADVERVSSVRDLFERSDVVGVHAPLTDETREIVGSEELRALGSGGILVNAARGGLVDEDALVEALRSDTIWGAGIDVFHEEPAPSDHPLFDCDSAVVSPHMAGSTRESVPAKDRGAAENVRDVYEGRLPESTVNRDELCLWVANDGTGEDGTPSPDPF